MTMNKGWSDMKLSSYWKSLRINKSGLIYEENWNVILKQLEKKLLEERRK